MVETHCQQCSHRWDYTGKSDTYCTCPSCRTSVKVGRQEETDGDGEVAQEPREMREPQVVLKAGAIEREVPVTEGVAEIYEELLDYGRASEVRRQQVRGLESDVDEVREQVREVATVVKEFVESFDGGMVEYETIELDPEPDVDEQVAELVEKVRSGELSVEEALGQVETPEDFDGGIYDPMEEMEG